MVRTNENMLSLLADEAAIQRLINLFCRAVDRLDVDLLLSLYHPDAIDDHGVFSGNAHEFARMIVDNIGSLTNYGYHLATQSIIDVDGDQAVAESTFLGYHRVAGERDKITAYFGEAYAQEMERRGLIGTEQFHLSGGRYLDRFEKRGGVWKILKRRITNEWRQCGPAFEMTQGQIAAFNIPGSRDAHDPLYGNGVARGAG